MIMLMAAIAAIQSGGEPSTVQLWQNLHAGMSRDQVKAALPSDRIELTEGCSARVTTQIDRRAGLVSVTIRYGAEVTLSQRSGDAAERCVRIVGDSLSEKYGKPDATEPRPRVGSALGNAGMNALADRMEPRVEDIWRLGELLIENQWSARSGIVSYSYEPRPAAPEPPARNPAAANVL